MNDEPRPEGTGYHRSPEELHSGFNTFFNRPDGRGIKPLSTNKLKLFQQIVNNQKNVKFNDFVVILEAFGFYRTRGEGSHSIYKNEVVSEIINIQNVNGEAKPYQIRQFFSLVEKYNLRMEEKQ